MNTITFSWEKIKSYRDGSPTDINEAIKIWYEENVSPILKSYINEMKITGSYLLNVKPNSQNDLCPSFEKDDENLLNLLKGLHSSVAQIKKYNGCAFARITRLYSLNGIARATEIYKIISDTFSSTFILLSDDEKIIDEKMSKYVEVVKELLDYVFRLRLWIHELSIKFEVILDIDAKGMIANRIYRILNGVFNISVYGDQIGNLRTIITSSGTSNLFNKLKGMKSEDRMSLIEIDPYADEDEFFKAGGNNEAIISNNSYYETTEINEKFYYYTTSLSQDDFKAKVLYYYNTYKGSSDLIPIMGEFGSIEFVNLIMLVDYFKSLIDKEIHNIDAREFFKDLNLKCLITMGFAFNHMTPGEFSDELDKIVKPYPGIMEYSEWSKVYRYLRDNYGDWIHNQEFAYGTPELRDDPLKYNKHYVLFTDAYNQMDDYQTVIKFYKRQGLKPDFCSSYFPLNMILNS